MPGAAVRTDPRSGASSLAWPTNRIGTLAGSPYVMVATREYRLKAVAMDCPALMVVLEGTKRMRIGKERWVCPAGSYLIVHRAGSVDLENVPDAGSGRYLTWGCYFSWRVISLARSLLEPYEPIFLPGAPVAASLGEAAALRGPVEALLAGDLGVPAALDHGLLGVLVGLSRLGHGDFLRETAQTSSAQSRLIVASESGRH